MAKYKLVISLLPDGRINVDGPIDDGILCFGMMEAAKDVIRQFAARQQEAKRIVPVVADLAKMNGAG